MESPRDIFQSFIEQAIQGPKDPESLRIAAREMISRLSPEQYFRLMMDFMFQTQFSKNGITGIVCVPFTTSPDDGHDYPGTPFMMGSPGPLDNHQMMDLAASAIHTFVQSQVN